MKASNSLIEAIKRFEGFRGTAYRCPAGVWTIGYGHTAGVKRGDKMTEGEAERQLRRDLAEYEAFVDKLGVTCQQNKFDALVDFAYNLGCDALEGSTLFEENTGLRAGRGGAWGVHEVGVCDGSREEAEAGGAGEA